MRRWLWGVGALALFAGLLLLMRPRPADLGEAAVRSADVEQAVRLLLHEHQAHPQDLRLQAQLATAYERADEPGEGLEQLEALSRHAVLTREQRAQVRRLALADDRPARAYTILSGARQPRGASELGELVSLAIAAHHPNAALWDQMALVRLRPREPRALIRLRALAEQAGRYGVARNAQAGLMAVQPSPEEAKTLIQLDLAANDPTAGLADLERYAPPRDAQGLKQAYDFAVAAKQPHKALQYLKALDQLAGTPQTGLLLANQLIALHDTQALPYLARLYARYATNTSVRDLYLSQLASAGRVPEALALLQHAVQVQPDASEPHQRLVSFALGHSQLDVAIAELGRWTKRHPQDTDALHQLAIAQVWDTRSPLAWNTYAQIFARTSGQTAWREAWAKISQAQDDCTPAGLANLEALVTAEPQQLDYRRRLAAALLEADDSRAALRAQAALVALPGSTRDDALNLAEWLLWYGHDR
ncbi:MAG TPA: hypothetical protein V6D47_22445, partial [Oscillatoriaceae cyanobacterium]